MIADQVPFANKQTDSQRDQSWASEGCTSVGGASFCPNNTWGLSYPSLLLFDAGQNKKAYQITGFQNKKES